jgi:hypothetical protein
MRLNLDSSSIGERLAELQKEIKQLFQADRMYKKRGRRRGPQDIAARDQRVLRMRRILEVIARLTPRRTGRDV